MTRGKGVLDAIDNSLRAKSLLSAWMRENHDAFKTRLDARVPDWKVLTDLFADAGLTDRYGNKPKPESARKLWQRIKKEIEVERSEAEKSRRRPPPRAPVKSTPTIRSAAATKPAATTDDIRSMLSTGRKLPDPI